MKSKSVRLTGRRGLLALVHCARKDLHLDEETYRAVLLQVGGKASAAELGDQDLGRVVDRFRGLGWKPKGSAKPSRDGHVRKLWAVWNELCATGVVRNPNRAALKTFVKRMTNIDEPDWLDPAQVNRVIEALKKWAERVEKAAIEGTVADELGALEE